MRPLDTLLALALLLPLLGSGCTLVPHELHEPQFHNPWPQIRKVAIGPFYNLSEDPYVDQELIAQAYFNELQQIPGFEVLPIGTTRRAMQLHGIMGNSPEDFRRLAQILEVDAIVVGSVNDFTPYYPPRLAMTVQWYAANPCFHPMPNGYGLPWGRAEEEYIPDSLVEAAEFDLATAQLATQTPAPPPLSTQPQQNGDVPALPSGMQASNRNTSVAQAQAMQAEELAPGVVVDSPAPNGQPPVLTQDGFPPYWPDPRGFIPDPPKPICDDCRPTVEPILTHTRTYNGHDSDFTEALAGYYEFRDEARFGGWQAYLQRSDDFIRFCCYMHVTEMLAARGGARETKVVYRWPIGRYER